SRRTGQVAGNQSISNAQIGDLDGARSDIDADSAVAGNDVALVGVAGAVAVGTDERANRALNFDAIGGVGNRDRAAHVGADVVAGNTIVIGTRELNQNAAAEIARDNVALFDIRSAMRPVGADAVGGRAIENLDARVIGDCCRAAGVGADVVSGDDVQAGAGV